MDLFKEIRLPVGLETIMEECREVTSSMRRKEIDIDIFFHSFLRHLSVGSGFIIEELNINYKRLFDISLKQINKKRKNNYAGLNFSRGLTELFERCYYIGKEVFNRDDTITHELLFLSLLNLEDKKRPKALSLFLAENSEILETWQNYLILYLNNDLEEVSRGEIEADNISLSGYNEILSRFATNLNQLAKDGKFDSLIDFDNKLNELCAILCRKKKPNAILIGDAGSGKTQTVNMLAQAIVDGESPELLSDKVIYSLSLSSMVAGTEFRGQFEKRLEDFINEAKKYNNIILFIDEIHTLVGAGGGGAGQATLEASNMLKPALANGEISCIGATTPREYNLTIKKDSALERRFEPVFIKQPSKQKMASIVATVIEDYSEFHGVEYTQDFADNILDYCELFLSKRNYPDKAVDVIDQCGAMAKVDFWEFSEEEKLGKKLMLDKVKNGKVPEDEEIRLACDGIDKWSHRVCNSRPTVDVNFLKKYFASKVNPIYNILENDGEILKKTIIGQNNAIDEFINKTTDSLFAVDDSKNSFLFYGAKNSGRSFLCRKINELLIRGGAVVYSYNGIEFHDDFSYHKIIGYNQDSLGERVGLCPNCVIIIDDIDKAHHSCLNIFGQIMKDQKMQMLNGELVDFTNCFFIMSSDAKLGGSLGYSPNEDKFVSTLDSLLLTRIFCKIPLKLLDKEDFLCIVRQKANSIKDRLAKQGVDIEIEEKDLLSLVGNSFEQLNGNVSQYVNKKLKNK